jgi:hypothetical protein
VISKQQQQQNDVHSNAFIPPADPHFNEMHLGPPPHSVMNTSNSIHHHHHHYPPQMGMSHHQPYSHVDVSYGMPPEYTGHHSPTTPNVTNLNLDGPDSFALIHHNDEYSEHQRSYPQVESHMVQPSYLTMDTLFGGPNKQETLPSISYIRAEYSENHADDEFMNNNQFDYSD